MTWVTRHWRPRAEAFLQNRSRPCSWCRPSKTCWVPVPSLVSEPGCRLGDRAPAQRARAPRSDPGWGTPGQRDQHDHRASRSGKTILSQQYVFHNASPDRPAVYLSTVSEPFDKILRYAESLASLTRRRLESRSSMRTWGRADCEWPGGRSGVDRPNPERAAPGHAGDRQLQGAPGIL